MDKDDTQPTAEEIEAAQAESEAAFSGGFDDTNEADLSKDKPAEPAAAPAPADVEKKPESAPAPAAPAVAPDPYAGLPKEVRDQLALIPGIQHQLRSAEGRLAAMQRAQEAARQTAAPAPAKPRFEKVEKIRGELPEVAEAMEELFNHREPEPQPAAQADAADAEITREEAALSEEYPNWQATLGGTDFNLWLTTQAPEYQQKVRSTSKAATITAALARFDVHHSQSQEQQRRTQDVAAQRQQRVVASAAVQKGNARPAAQSSIEDEEADFVTGFKNA